MQQDINLIKGYMTRAALMALSNKPEGFNEADKSLGLASFIFWFLKGMIYKSVRDEYSFQEHFFEIPNNTGKEMAKLFVTTYLCSPEITVDIQRRIPYFQPTKERNLCTIDDPHSQEWMMSISRSIVILTREMAYLLTGFNGEKIERLPDNNTLIQVGRLWLEEIFGDRVAQALLGQDTLDNFCREMSRNIL